MDRAYTMPVGIWAKTWTIVIDYFQLNDRCGYVISFNRNPSAIYFFNGFFFNLVLKSTGNFFLLSHTETELRGQSKQRTSLRKVTVRRYFVRSISGEAIPAKDRTLMNLSHASKISKIVL